MEDTAWQQTDCIERPRRKEGRVLTLKQQFSFPKRASENHRRLVADTAQLTRDGVRPLLPRSPQEVLTRSQEVRPGPNASSTRPLSASSEAPEGQDATGANRPST